MTMDVSNTTRRAFLASAGLGLAGLAGCQGGFWGARRRYAAQLYSIHKIVWKQTAHVFSELKAAGYDGVEFAGYGGHTAAELRKMLRDAGLAGAGAHVNGDVDLTGDALKRALDFAAEAGIDALVTPHAKRDSADAYRRFGAAMGAAAEAAAPYGIRVGVHCTYHHFTTKYGEKTAWDMIYAETSPRLQQQVDTCNAFHVGVDVVKLLQQYPGRHFTIHLKENIPSEKAILGERPTDGSPCVPWRAVMDQLASEEVYWYVVEAEAIPYSLMPLKASRRFLETV